jgi:type IV pilus assembly protein PilM
MSVGLDIGSKTIKIVELSKEGGGWRLRGSGVIGYTGRPPEHLTDEKDFAALAQAVKKLHKEANISSSQIYVSLPEQQVFTRTIKFPPLNDAEIASAVKWEAEQYIPIPVNEAIIQHQIIERKDDTTPPSVLVLLVASPRTLVEKYVKVVEMAGLNPTVVETELMALTRALAPPDQTVLLVDFGARSTDIAIAKNGILSFSRSLSTAGEAFTRAVAQTLGIQEAQAEEYKKAYGLSESQLEGKIRKALDPVFGIVSEEIRKAIHFYQTEEKGESPRSVIVSGGSAGMPDIVSMLSKIIGLEVVVGNPFVKIAMSPETSRALAPYGPLYPIAVGLAMRG